MERNSQTQGIILSVKDYGENNRIAQILSPDEGIFSAIIYGGPKSRLRSLVQPFSSGIVYIYRDESKNSIKLTDFDAKKTPLSLRENIFKAFAASLACEIVYKTKYAGDSENAFILLTALIDGTDKVEESEARLGLIRFLWRYLGLLGVQPDVLFCHECKCKLIERRGISYFNSRENTFYCRDCIPYNDIQNPLNFPVDEYGITYLTAINELPPRQVREILIPSESANQLKQIVFHMIEKHCEFHLDTLESGRGIL